MSVDLYKALHGFATAIFGAPYGEVGVLPGSIASLNGISTTMGFF